MFPYGPIFPLGPLNGISLLSRLLQLLQLLHSSKATKNLTPPSLDKSQLCTSWPVLHPAHPQVLGHSSSAVVGCRSVLPGKRFVSQMARLESQRRKHGMPTVALGFEMGCRLQLPRLSSCGSSSTCALRESAAFRTVPRFVERAAGILPGPQIRAKFHLRPMSVPPFALGLWGTYRGTPSNAFSNLSGSFFSLIPTAAISVTFRIRINLIHPGNALQTSPVVGVLISRIAKTQPSPHG